MRKSRLSQEEVAELDEFKRRDTRNSGYNLMSVRDRGWSRLSNGSLLQWHTDSPLRECEARQSVYNGDLLIDGKAFTAEELMKYLRWA